ncbi:MAG: hypothetical protein JO364_02040 [Pseudonocardiales bacterium]|nr:hypothetical protein [Pseudonocardiales bacterium]MBV9029094.1 hypothetical protein [Pseudonocardiales bacterium]
MSTTHSSLDVRQRSTLAMQRSHGAASGLLLVLLGAWGALIPFVGPYFHYTFGVTVPWFFTYDRLWLNVLPGAAVFLGGLILGPSANRASGGLGAWLALLGGIWFATGPVISQLWRAGGMEAPIGPPSGGNLLPLLEQLGYFYGLGTLVIALAAFALGRMTMRSVPD